MMENLWGGRLCFMKQVKHNTQQKIKRMLASYPEGTELPLPSTLEAAHNCGILAKKLWTFPLFDMQEIQKVVETHRAHADYSSRYSNIKTDFYRHYYYTRSKRVKTGSLEEATDDTITYMPIPNALAEVERQMWLDSFCERLNEKDAEILRLLDQGHTQQEIADLLGYANHSGVNKHIGPAMRKYKEEENEALNRSLTGCTTMCQGERFFLTQIKEEKR